MTMRMYLIFSGVVFAFVAIVHALRVANSTPVEVGIWNAPLWVSWLGFLLAGAMSVWAFGLAFPRFGRPLHL